MIQKAGDNKSFDLWTHLICQNIGAFVSGNAARAQAYSTEPVQKWNWYFQYWTVPRRWKWGFPAPAGWWTPMRKPSFGSGDPEWSDPLPTSGSLVRPALIRISSRYVPLLVGLHLRWSWSTIISTSEVPGRTGGPRGGASDCRLQRDYSLVSLYLALQRRNSFRREDQNENSQNHRGRRHTAPRRRDG